MLTVIFIMLLGVGAGFLLRRWQLPILGRIITMLIWLLLFLLGVEVGCNQRIVRGIATLGAEAILISLAGTVGAAALSAALWRFSGHRSARGDDPSASEPRKSHFRWQTLAGSLVIVAFFATGVVTGLLGWFDISALGVDISFYALGALMFCVGVSVGHDDSTLRNLRSLSPRLMLLPVATILGTLAGCAMITPLLNGRELYDTLAIGSGFGYYSLSSIFITEYRGAELGTVALLANIAREILTLVGAPLLCRLFGPLAPISAGGATTMDTTLPVITAVSGKGFVVLSIFHGFVTDFSVPFLVTLFCSI